MLAFAQLTHCFTHYSRLSWVTNRPRSCKEPLELLLWDFYRPDAFLPHSRQHQSTTGTQYRWYSCISGHSDLAVECLTAVCDVLRSNHAVGSCHFRKNYCDLQPWALAVRILPAVPRSTQLSTLCGMVNEYQLSGWVKIINGDGGCRW